MILKNWRRGSATFPTILLSLLLKLLSGVPESLQILRGPEPWQLWVLEQIRDGLKTPGEAVKLAIASGHGVGKTALSSWIVLWAICTFPDARGIVTASSEAMLMTRFRAELRLWFQEVQSPRVFRADRHVVDFARRQPFPDVEM